MNLLRLLPIALLLFLSACDKKGPSTGGKDLKEIPVITGILQKDINAQPIGTLGTPNTNTGALNDYNRIVAYPNPCSDVFHLVINSGDTATAHIWMVKGEYQEGNTNAEEYIWGEANVVPIDLYHSLEVGSNSISIDVANAPEGYYRLYTEFNSVRLWDNIWVNR